LPRANRRIRIGASGPAHPVAAALDLPYGSGLPRRVTAIPRAMIPLHRSLARGVAADPIATASPDRGP
jgi:hypothetical protein